MPDDCPRPARADELTQKVRVNFADGLYEFEMAFGRAPRSWMDYHHGMAHLARATARESVRQASAGRLAQAQPDDWKRWLTEQRTHADWG